MADPVVQQGTHQAVCLDWSCLPSSTVVACGLSVWLFDGFGSSFSRTIRRDFASFGRPGPNCRRKPPQLSQVNHDA